ncbi:hypothetical protein BJ912DRAFT_915191 [Pholiota molesta]|nr:hypothetical protein BJ912DRAFT_915191 [Pholiota molesta]
MQPMSNVDTIRTVWTAEDTELLYVTLDYAPDTLPCDLAVICRKPCREVCINSYGLFLATKTSRDKNRYIVNANTTNPRYRLPCQHTGPCDAKAKCACFLTRAPCYSRCGCNKSCPRKWKGCSCAKAAKVCGTKKCSCFRAFIECDPEVCIPCEANFADMSSNLCRNVGIQRGTFKLISGASSLPFFPFQQEAKYMAIRTEYVGELIYNPTVRSRAGASTHKGRSYIFDLNRRVSLDSAYAGNGTRYINHSARANCDTAVVLVNGEHRIGVYAARRLEEGEELFIDYGPKFFSNAPDAPNPS